MSHRIKQVQVLQEEQKGYPTKTQRLRRFPRGNNDLVNQMEKFGREEKQGEGRIPSRRKSLCAEPEAERARKNGLERRVRTGLTGDR